MGFCSVQFSSVAQSCLTPWRHGLQHARLPCPSPTPGVYLNSRPLSWWCHPTISSSVVPFSSRLQSFPTSGSLPGSQFFASGGHSIGVLKFSFNFSPLVAQMVKNPPSMWETWVWSLSREDPLKEGIATHWRRQWHPTPVLWPPHAKSWLIGKDFNAGRDWGQEEKGTTEDEMAGSHHQLDGYEFE